MTKWITTDTGLITGVVTGVFRCPQAFPTLEVADAPDGLAPGWALNGSAWEPGAALIASETEASNDATERTAVKAVYAALKAGTATNAQAQRAIAYLLKRS